MSLIEILLYPFLFIIEQLYLLGYSLTNNHGLSIVLLSFIISFLLLPIFIIIEKAKKRNDAIRQRMKPIADEIKRCYKGQERFYYLKTLNRQHGYSPTKALIPVLSLLIQIPFFIAAFQFLGSYEPLEGKGFLFIDDLSAPDGLFGSINILPIVMTLVNIVTAYLYTRGGSQSERNQMLAIAGVFLLLLFNQPSGLVLYWTMNNVFSFFRLFITNPEVFKRKSEAESRKDTWLMELKPKIVALTPKIIKTFLVVLLIALLSQVNWALNHGFNDFGLRIALAFGGSVALSVFVLILNLAFRINVTLTDKTFKEIILSLWPKFRITFFSISAIVILTQINWALKYSFDDFILRLLAALFAGGALTSLLSIIVLAYQEKISFKSKKIKLRVNELSQNYVVALWLLIIVGLTLQVHWALNHSFNDIVVRIILVFVVAWVTVYSIANIAYAIKSGLNLSVKELLTRIKPLQARLFYGFGLLTLIVLTLQLNWMLKHGFHDVAIRSVLAIFVSAMPVVLFAFFYALRAELLLLLKRIKISTVGFYSIIFLAIYFYFASKFYFSGTNTTLGYISLGFAIIAQALGILYFTRYNSIKLNWLKQLSTIFIVILFFYQILNIWALGITEELTISFLNLNWTVGITTPKDIAFTGILITFVTLPFFVNQQNETTGFPKVSIYLYLLCVLYLVGFVFLWNPIAIYSSYPTNFEFPAVDILKNNLSLFVIAITILTGVFLILPKKAKYYWSLVVLSLAVLSFVHNTIMPINVGTLQENKFLHQDKLAKPTLFYLIEGFGILIITLSASWVLRKRHVKQAIWGVSLLNAILIAQSLQLAISTGSFLKKDAEPEEISSSISLSKSNENIVFIILDMFHGWYMKNILEDEPHLKTSLDGFVWYPNTLSVSSVTSSSIGPMIGGYSYTADKLNEDEDRTLEEKITEITTDFLKKVKGQGFRFTGNRMIYSKIDNDKFDTFIPVWHDEWDAWNSKLKIGVAKEIGFELLWGNAAFYSAPLALKPKVYNNGNWFFGEVKTNENTSKTQPYNFLRLLPYISNAKSTEPSFVYIHSMASHHPWDIVDDEGTLVPDVTPFENNKWSIETLSKWFEWMKRNDVYDNTKIVIASDHGPHWWHFKGDIDMDMDIPIIPNPNLSSNEDISMSLYALLLVKDFGSKGDIKTDWRFMSNADASAIIFNENDPTKAEPPLSRKLPTSIVLWERKIWELNKLRILHNFEVTDNAYDLTKWERK